MNLGLALSFSSSRLSISPAAAVGIIQSATIGTQSEGTISLDYRAIGNIDVTVMFVPAGTIATTDGLASQIAAQSVPGGVFLSGTLTAAGTSLPLGSLPDGMDDRFDVFVMPNGGGDGDIVYAQSAVIDSLDPTLSSPTAEATGTNELTLTVTTDEDTGTIYALPRNPADPLAGESAMLASAFTNASPSVGANDIVVTGLTGGVEQVIDVMQDDGFGNRSAIVTSNGATPATAFEALPLPTDFGTELRRDSNSYFTEHTDGAHLLAAYTGSTIYVDAVSGDDGTGTGSAGNPYATLTTAIANASALDILSMAPGEYAIPTAQTTIPLAFVRTGSSGDVLIGNFDDLSTAQVDATGTLWNVDDVTPGATFFGFVRLDIATGTFRGAGRVQTNTIATDYQDAGTYGGSIASVFAGGSSANFGTGSADTLPTLISGGHIRAWTDQDTQTFDIGANAYFGQGIVIAGYASPQLAVSNGAHVVLDGCEVYGGVETIFVNGTCSLSAFNAAIGGSNSDIIHYGNNSLGLEVNVDIRWPGSTVTDNASTAHGTAQVLRVGGSYQGGSRTIHDIDTSTTFNFSNTVSNAIFGDGTLMQIGISGAGSPELVRGDNTFAGTFANDVVVDSAATETEIDLATTWPYS